MLCRRRTSVASKGFGVAYVLTECGTIEGRPPISHVVIRRDYGAVDHRSDQDQVLLVDGNDHVLVVNAFAYVDGEVATVGGGAVWGGQDGVSDRSEVPLPSLALK
ncbi:hypothetical protein OPV22_013041 [Ensete ventricosum]|uniref:Uncharacterized protein n=1 Tax=Ensete ventricosum TaxID=4639 RepID=A0AAV8R7D9_ENSVE|nr:hypothetical protein OPV22_013041 [Ensete ventricosum]